MSQMPAATKKGGMCQSFPDVCKTPAGTAVVPIPYPNLAQMNAADGVTSKVLFEKKEVVVESSAIPNSSGDEAGTAGGGVKSATQMAQVAFKKYSSKVFAEGKKVVFHTAMAAHNGTNANAVGVHSVPSQSKVLVAM